MMMLLQQHVVLVLLLQQSNNIKVTHKIRLSTFLEANLVPTQGSIDFQHRYTRFLATVHHSISC